MEFTWSYQVDSNVSRSDLFGQRACEALKAGFTGAVHTLTSVSLHTHHRACGNVPLTCTHTITHTLMTDVFYLRRSYLIQS